MAAYKRFYEGDIGEEFVRAVREWAGCTLWTISAMARAHRGACHDALPRIDVYKLDTWVQGR